MSMKKNRKVAKLTLKLDTIALLNVRGGGLIADTQFAGCGSTGCDTFTASGGCSAVCV